MCSHLGRFSEFVENFRPWETDPDKRQNIISNHSSDLIIVVGKMQSGSPTHCLHRGNLTRLKGWQLLSILNLYQTCILCCPAFFILFLKGGATFLLLFCLEVCRRVKRLWEFGSHCRVIAKTYLPKLLSNGDNPLESVFYSFNFRQNCRKKPFYTANVSFTDSSRVYQNKLAKLRRCTSRVFYYEKYSLE